ncbi:MAG: hypothetical protein RBG1_1C00001G0664 [candidate division Zixibacteria bacterium RBG-1]|nr:MAG: hypothetical protein RBG1_1C00001G0664 [candidate division Zixibacteria bacterium RBG-1]OGC85902.1 MAG: hypothetical protein A2V73_08090 [candidate division Zixibacteria bacterium RBG_19FT_COMBO_42_43]
MSEYTKYVIALREVARVGPKRFAQLILHYGTPDNVYNSTLEELTSLPRMSAGKAQEILASQEKLKEIENQMDLLAAQDIGISTVLDENYPALLQQIDDPPPLLYYKGKFPLIDKTGVALIGTTNPSTAGVEKAVAWGKELAQQDVVVVSGLAKGIDGAAHVGALSGNGKTYAVLGSGLFNIYPPEHENLAAEITKAGALVSEFPVNSPVTIGQLMARNRIVVGLSQAVIIVEEDSNSSGTSEAAQKTIEQGRPLFILESENKKSVEKWVQQGAILLKDTIEIEMLLQYI